MRRLSGLAGAILLSLLLPLLLSPYYLIVLSGALAFASGCRGLNLLLGHTGLLSFGQAAYFGVGAYTGSFIYTFTPITSFESTWPPAFSRRAASQPSSASSASVRPASTSLILTLAFTQMVHALFISGTIFQPFGGVGKGLFRPPAFLPGLPRGIRVRRYRWCAFIIAGAFAGVSGGLFGQVYGLLLIAVILALPGGLTGGAVAVLKRVRSPRV